MMEAKDAGMNMNELREQIAEYIAKEIALRYTPSYALSPPEMSYGILNLIKKAGYLSPEAVEAVKEVKTKIEEAKEQGRTEIVNRLRMISSASPDVKDFELRVLALINEMEMKLK